MLSLLEGASAETILAWPDGVRKRSLDIIEVLEGMLSERLDEMTNPFTVLASSIKELELTSNEIKEVSVLLQTGQETNGYSVGRRLSIFPAVHGGERHTDHVGKIFLR